MAVLALNGRCGSECVSSSPETSVAATLLEHPMPTQALGLPGFGMFVPASMVLQGTWAMGRSMLKAMHRDARADVGDALAGVLGRVAVQEQRRSPAWGSLVRPRLLRADEPAGHVLDAATGATLPSLFDLPAHLLTWCLSR